MKSTATPKKLSPNSERVECQVIIKDTIFNSFRIVGFGFCAFSTDCIGGYSYSIPSEFWVSYFWLAPLSIKTIFKTF